MEAYYSSDEEIAWGPITLREIKGDLKRGTVRKPNRRHTVLCKIPNNKMDESLSKEINKLDVSGTSTAYYTPNESLKTNDFLDKLSHVINVPCSELSEYASVLEYTENSNSQTESQTEESNSQNEAPIVPVITTTSADEFSHNDTCTNFIKTLENRKTHYDIENFQQTLVENSYIECEEDQITEEGSTDNKYNFLLEKKFETEDQEEVIVLSDDSSIESCDGDINEAERVPLFKKEIDFDCNKKEFTERCSEDEGEDELYENNLEDNVKEELFIIKNEFNPDNEHYNDISTCEENDKNEDSFLLTPTMEHKLSTIKESLSASPVVVPEIDLTQFDDSVKDDSLQLNDTLEEMNRLLCQGLNYSMSDDELIENTPVKKDVEPEQVFTPLNEITSNRQLFSDGKEKASHIPKRKFIPTSAEKKINTNTWTKASPKTNFKVPEIPRPKLFNPTPPKTCPNLKNIVSPVALYIKNSPRNPLKQNVPLREVPRIVTTTKVKSANKENFEEFPEVVYEPSKKQIASTEKHIVPPPYMMKLNIKEAHITKHEGRINRDLNKSTVSKKLLNTDITINQSLLDNTGDISVLTNKQAFIK